MKQKEINIKAFVNSYLATAAWVTCDSDECQEFTRNAKKVAKEDCRKFIATVMEKFGKEKGTELLIIDGKDVTHLAAHCFSWLVIIMALILETIMNIVMKMP